MNKYWVSASIAGVGFLGGLCLGASHNDLATKLGFALGGGLVTGAPTAFFYDSKLNQQNKQIESLQETARRINNNLTSEKKSRTNLEKLNEESLNEILAITKSLEVIAGSLKDACESELIADAEINRLISRINELTGECKQLQELCDQKETELQEFARDYNTNLTKEFEAKKQQLVKDEIAKEFELTTEAFQLMNELEEFTKQVYERHQGQREQLLDTNGKYHAHLQKVIAKHNEAYEELMQVNELLELRIRYLEQTIEQGMVQPVYREYGVGSINGKVVNRFIELTWNDLGIPLEALGIDDSTDCVLAGLGYPKKNNPEAVVQSLTARKKDFAQRIGIYEITSLVHDGITDTLALRFRCDRPKPPSDEQIYKDGLIPASQFCDQLFLATDHRKQGKPTLRVMAATGDGKGIAMKNFISYMVEQPNWEIWLSDPVHGSDEDYWHCPKMAKGVSEATRGYRMFADLHRARQAKSPVYTDKSVLGIFDEFDKQHTDDDKETGKAIMTAIRHTNQRQILIGQCAEVGANGWAWDDMNNCSLLALGNSIGTLIKHLNKDMGWSIKKVNEVKRKKEQFEDWARLKNENSDRPNENAYRIALLIVGGDKYSFLEVPSAHKGILRDGKGVFRDGLNIKPLETKESITPDAPQAKSAYPKKLSGEYRCPDCAHVEQTFFDTTSKGTPRYKCDNCPKKAVISKFTKIS